MGAVKVIVIIAITMALSIALAMKSIGEVEEKMPFPHTETSYDYPKELPIKEKKVLQLPSKRVISRFLAERNRNAADHCNKDEEICYVKEGTNYTCCNNKCVDLSTDKDNCGACKKKCKYTHECCRGECVDVAYDKRHCGSCNRPCKTGEYCFYGLCNYA
ncbi:hypothetical protein I3843_12G130800 [Carya illinoinensis]|uniref:Stigma-specific Stig1 family protein n=1 Tax=Carya illinoinensis TaxID=32201 RepID=A0A8T1NW19_CARIL|nr:stigma-specific STIG1-like protein 1 [Carya illinoinensis]KAG2678122.1 hypothetical protein I3760_12G128600 [Carya illinoinensis]KAG6634645.1 hypothetical protein CIPAW_12G131900 [Carya illinoinensis]KAG6685821.1 hypothetical protein I3842_12G130800 [Carya illinoinensis]KAG7953867.1 hypothetical protein I3843_12G130800 [Carya illinoinensis]